MSEATLARRRTLPRRVALFAATYTFGVAMLGTTLPTPLYPLYEQRYHFGALMTTIIYAVYAVGVLVALVLVGSASDAVGRRPLLLAGLAASVLSALLFVTNAGLVVLIVGRVLSGIAAGIFTGTATVALVELALPERRGQVSTVATAVNMFGLGCGPLLAGLMAAWLPAPLLLPYLANLVLLLPAIAATWFLPETVRDRSRGWPRPQRPRVPAEARAVFIPAAAVAFAAFGAFGLVAAIGPTFLRNLLHLPSPALAGVIVFAMFAGSALGQIALTRLAGRTALPVGCGVLILGLAGIGVALAAESLTLVTVGTIVVGLGQGLTFSSGIAAITAASPSDRRAETISTFFIVAYVAISIPAVLVGVASTIWNLQIAGIVFTIVMGALTAAALIAVLIIGRGQRQKLTPLC
ncbi:MAG: MFS transporter [Antricoccus sp.]